MSWTEERVEALKLHWAAGLSCSAIANELGDVTRNAVIGKVHRLGIAGRPGKAASQPRPQPRKSTATRRFKQKPPGKPPGINDLPPEIVADPVSFVDLKAHHCRWPVDGAGYQTVFCGGTVVEKQSYCARHCSMAYRPPEPRRSRGAHAA